MDQNTMDKTPDDSGKTFGFRKEEHCGVPLPIQEFLQKVVDLADKENVGEFTLSCSGTFGKRFEVDITAKYVPPGHFEGCLQISVARRAQLRYRKTTET